jgi:hypothetical protein
VGTKKKKKKKKFDGVPSSMYKQNRSMGITKKNQGTRQHAVAHNQATTMKTRRRRELIRGPKSAWIFFIQEKQKSTVESEPDENQKKKTFSDLCHTWSPVWKELSVSDKERFQSMHLTDKERYKKELASLTPDEREHVTRSSKKKRRRSRAPGLPKPVRSAYIWFVINERTRVMEEKPELNFTEVGKELGKRWNDLSQEKRHPYHQMNSEDKERYRKQKEQRLNEAQVEGGSVCVQ